MFACRLFYLAGQCLCTQTKASVVHVKPGHSKATVDWPAPQFRCMVGHKPEVTSYTVEPRVTSPHAFSIGKHTITYSYKLKGGVNVVCPVSFEIKGKCFPTTKQGNSLRHHYLHQYSEERLLKALFTSRALCFFKACFYNKNTPHLSSLHSILDSIFFDLLKNPRILNISPKKLIRNNMLKDRSM